VYSRDTGRGNSREGRGGGDAGPQRYREVRLVLVGLAVLLALLRPAVERRHALAHHRARQRHIRLALRVHHAVVVRRQRRGVHHIPLRGPHSRAALLGGAGARARVRRLAPPILPGKARQQTLRPPAPRHLGRNAGVRPASLPRRPCGRLLHRLRVAQLVHGAYHLPRPRRAAQRSALSALPGAPRARPQAAAARGGAGRSGAERGGAPAATAPAARCW